MKYNWSSKKVLVTGGSGFVGTNLVKSLISKKAKVICFPGDVRSFNSVKNEFIKFKPDIVYHLAAQPLTEVGKTSPLSTFQVNIQGTWNVLEASRLINPEKIVVASTTHVYGDNPNLPYKEDLYPQPSRPYETSKASADLLSQSYADTYNLPVEVCRMVNLYGPGDKNSSRIFPSIIKKLLEGNNPEMFDVGVVRDFLYIDDAVQAYLRLAEVSLPNTKRARVINFGTGKPVSVIELVKKIIRAYGDKNLKLIIKPIPNEREHEIQKQYVSIQKAKKVLNWKPRVNLSEGIRMTIRYYKTNRDII